MAALYHSPPGRGKGFSGHGRRIPGGRPRRATIGRRGVGEAGSREVPAAGSAARGGRAKGRGVFHRRRAHPARWLLAAAAALTIGLAATFLTPRSWLGFLLPDGRSLQQLAPLEARPWLVLSPPPEIEPAPRRRPVEPPRPEPPAPPPADWWREGWRIRVAAAAREDLRPTPEDSVVYLLETLGLPHDIMSRARPNSLLEARLILLAREESYRFDELKPYFGAVTRARAYADLQSRKADMYDDHLRQEIIVPD